MEVSISHPASFVTDTIAAISTAFGEAAISVLRMTGSESVPIASRVFKGPASLDQIEPRISHFGRIMDATGMTIDSVLLTYFKGPASYTGEDVIEISCHGGILVTRRIYELLLQNGARAAGAGEFTQRAFLNGKMDLTQAEAVMDLIHAQSELALEAASRQLEGRLGQAAEKLRADLIQVAAQVEAYIDFPDEDIDPETGAALQARLGAVRDLLRSLLDTAEHGRILRAGARTVIAGAPNVGKSSLLNLLTGFERAIVSPMAGTTRDTIEEMLHIHGLPFRLVDTAGLREHTSDFIEQHGMERTRRELAQADVILEIVDGSRESSAAPRSVLGGPSSRPSSHSQQGGFGPSSELGSRDPAGYTALLQNRPGGGSPARCHARRRLERRRNRPFRAGRHQCPSPSLFSTRC